MGTYFSELVPQDFTSLVTEHQIRRFLSLWSTFSVTPITLSRMHRESTHWVLGHLHLRLLVRSHCSVIRLLRTALSASALRCAYSLARSLTHYGAHGKEVRVWVCDWEFYAWISYSFNPLGHCAFLDPRISIRWCVRPSVGLFAYSPYIHRSVTPVQKCVPGASNGQYWLGVS